MLDCFYSEITGTDYENQSAATGFIITNHGNEVLNNREQKGFFFLATASDFGITAHRDLAKGKKKIKPSGTPSMEHTTKNKNKKYGTKSHLSCSR